MQNSEYMKPSEIAVRLGVSRQAVYKWISEGRLQSAKFGKTVRVLRSSFEAFEQEGRSEGAQKNGTPELVFA